MNMPLRPATKAKRVHLATESGGRSRCRYTSRPSVRATFVPLTEFMALPMEVRCVECERKAVAAHSASSGSEWRSGYFCAVAMLLREEGGVSAAALSLFRQGGSTESIDASDLELFREHGLS